MKEAFYGSLFYKGVRGGAVIINDNAVEYKNQTITIPAEYKNIVMPFPDIEKVVSGGNFIFPTVTIYLKNGRHYKFLIFNRKRFFDVLQHTSIV